MVILLTWRQIHFGSWLVIEKVWDQPAINMAKGLKVIYKCLKSNIMKSQ